MADPLYITFLWHMHQPFYRDPERGEYFLPWTYLHGVKDYYDMAAIVDETPGARVVFNLVPSLLEQLAEYAAGTAVDPYLVRGKMAPADMAEEDRLFVIENFFSANRQRMIEPQRRYLELLFMAGDGRAARKAERLRNFRDQDILDLQVWFFLSWTGESARNRYPELRELVRKGRNFTLGDKELLFARQQQLLEEIIPLYRRLHEEGKAELSMSPHFHPILPLLCDMKSARGAMPRVNLPTAWFRHPEDAASQVRTGIACFEKHFGFAPAGIWPSEGAVSDEALAIIAQHGFKWAASDEGILSHTLPDGLGPGREALYQAYAFAAGDGTRLFFRDHALSDLIGFTYSQWEPGRAVDDFIGRLGGVRLHAPGSRVVPVILDGENAWEYYPDNGYDFLKRLYGRIDAEPGLELATFSDLQERIPEKGPLRHIHPGSWISANYGVWVGHPEENLAWDMLERAREAAVQKSPQVAARLAGEGADEEGNDVCREVLRSLYVAEGSDWFWWYGDDHFSPYSDRFDLLFRRRLMHVYRLLELDVPQDLLEPIKRESPAGFVRDPADLITPTISGFVTDYFEWLAAGLYNLTRQSSAMHAAESLLHSFFYGFDRKSLYFRIDGATVLDKTLQPGDSLNLHLIHGREYCLPMGIDTETGPLLVKDGGEWKETEHLCRWKIVRICEAQIPLAAINPEPGGKLFAYITLMRRGDEIGRWPIDAAMVLKYAGPELELETWII
ncbi:MAG TPA: glycoside hydrolase family 57 protein [Geobacteraceae bacterium]